MNMHTCTRAARCSLLNHLRGNLQSYLRFWLNVVHKVALRHFPEDDPMMTHMTP